MSDRELLEAAARAAGYSIHTWLGDIYHTDFGRGVIWNPLKDDGDAFRLMADLGLAVHCDEEGAQVWHSHDVCGSYGFAECDVSDSCDKKQAVRRAIVISAVEIGKRK